MGDNVGLDLLLKVLEKVDTEEIALNLKMCPNFRALKICRICKRNCPTGAIKVSKDLELDRDKCIGCGICATVCPNGVFEMKNMPDIVIFDQIKEVLSKDDSLTFVCDRCNGATDKAKGSRRPPYPREGPVQIELPCLGRVHQAFILYAWSLGAKTIRFANEQCDDDCICFDRAKKVQERSIGIAYHFIRSMGPAEKVPKGSKGKGKGKGTGSSKEKTGHGNVISRSDAPTRRDFISQGVRTGVLGAINFMIPFDLGLDPGLTEKREAPHFPKRSITAKREYLLGILRRKKPRTHLVRLNPKKRIPFPLADVRIKEALCNGCYTCISVCPTGALGKVEHNAKNVIYFDLGRCTACRLCKELCPEDAIWFNNILNLDRINDRGKEMISHPVKICGRCNLRYTKIHESDECPNCN